jgi:hypothetical protein
MHMIHRAPRIETIRYRSASFATGQPDVRAVTRFTPHDASLAAGPLQSEGKRQCSGPDDEDEASTSCEVGALYFGIISVRDGIESIVLLSSR